eukprot:11157806-Lingulodinium_polyedra.AAC.1
MERASARSASRRGCETSVRSHHCAEFVKRCAMTRSSRRFAATTAREPHARALRARARKLARAWSPRTR